MDKEYTKEQLEDAMWVLFSRCNECFDIFHQEDGSINFYMNGYSLVFTREELIKTMKEMEQ